MPGTFVAEVLAGLGAQYLVDFTQRHLSALVGLVRPNAARRALGKALEGFLSLFQEELEFARIFAAEEQPFHDAIREFLRQEHVMHELARPFDGECRSIDTDSLATSWRALSPPALPAGFDWDNISKQYVRAVHRVMREDEDLRPLLDSRHVEATLRSSESAAGLVPGFELGAYRQSLIDSHGHLKLDSLHASGYEYRVRLWQVFVAQTVREALPPLELPKEHLRRLVKSGEADATLNPEEQEAYRRRYLEQPLRNVLEVTGDPGCRLTVMLGDPGSGKSTLLQYLALAWTEQPQTPLPLLIELGKYARDPNHPTSFLDYLHRGASAICHLNQHDLDDRLRSGRAWLLLDGLDEVFDRDIRQTLISEIIRFASAEYPLAKVIVTSRIIGYTPQRLRDAGFRHFTLQEFAPDQVEQFLRRWHSVAFGAHPDGPRLRDRLLKAIDESPSIRELAGNPLLLTMMAILNRSQELPRDRAELYDQASRVLLHEWDIHKGLPPDEKLSPDTIGRQEKQAMLRRIARHMQAAPQGLAGNLIEQDDLETLLTEYLQTIREVEAPRALARRIMQQLRERNFILCYSGADRYAFVHRTFLEYFCAADFVWRFQREQTLTFEQLKREVFGRHWADEPWHEVLRLIAGMIGESFVGEIIDYLMAQDTQSAEGQNLFLAAKCLSEVRHRLAIHSASERLLEEVKRLRRFDLPYDYREHDSDGLDRVRRVRMASVSYLATVWREDPDTLPYLKARAQSDEDSAVRGAAVQELARGWPDDPDTLPYLKVRAQSDGDWAVRWVAVQELARGWREDPDTLPILKARAQSDEHPDVRQAAVEELARGWRDDPDTLPYLKARAQSDEHSDFRQAAVQGLARAWPDDPDTLPILKARAQSDEHPDVRQAAVQELARGWLGDPEVAALLQSHGRAPGVTLKTT